MLLADACWSSWIVISAFCTLRWILTRWPEGNFVMLHPKDNVCGSNSTPLTIPPWIWAYRNSELRNITLRDTKAAAIPTPNIITQNTNSCEQDSKNKVTIARTREAFHHHLKIQIQHLGSCGFMFAAPPRMLSILELCNLRWLLTDQKQLRHAPSKDDMCVAVVGLKIATLLLPSVGIWASLPFTRETTQDHSTETS